MCGFLTDSKEKNEVSSFTPPPKKKILVQMKSELHFVKVKN